MSEAYIDCVWPDIGKTVYLSYRMVVPVSLSVGHARRVLKNTNGKDDGPTGLPITTFV